MHANADTMRYVPVTADGHVFCFQSSEVKTIGLREDCSLLDEPASNGLLGQMPYAGHDIPVLGLRHALGKPWPIANLREHVVVVSVENSCCGFLVDDVQRAQDVDPQNLSPLPKLATNPQLKYFRGVVRLPNVTDDLLQSALILSPQGLLCMDDATADFTLPPLDLGNLLAQRGARHKKLIQFPLAPADDHELAIVFSATEVVEVIPAAELLPVPHAGPTFQGLLPWRNRFVPIVELGQHLGVDPLPLEQRTRIAIIRSPQDQLVGFYSNEDIHTLRFPLETIPCSLPRAIHANLVAGTFAKQDGSTLVMPSSKSLCDSPAITTAA